MLTVFLEITFRICGPPPNLYISKDSAKMELWKCVHFRNFSSQRFIWMIRLHRLLTDQPLIPLRCVFGAISVATCIFYKTLPLLPAACLAPSPKLPSLAVRQAACRRYWASTALLHPSLTGFQLSLERYSSAIIAPWTPPLQLPPCPAPSLPLQMHLLLV